MVDEELRVVLGRLFGPFSVVLEDLPEVGEVGIGQHIPLFFNLLFILDANHVVNLLIDVLQLLLISDGSQLLC